MPTRVEIPGQGVVEFPDGMSDEQISAVIRQNAQPPKTAQPQTGFIQDAINFGKGALSGSADIGNNLINAASYVPRQFANINAKLYGQKNPLEEYNQQRQASLQDYNKANDSIPFTAGRIGANIAGTLGAPVAVGGALTGLSQAPKALALAKALQTSGTVGTLPERIAGGAGAGAIATLMTDPENVGTGAALGGAVPVVSTIASKTAGGVKSLVEPFYAGGQENILGRALRGAAGNQADDAMRNLASAQPVIPGSQPTSGMVAGSPGIAALERASVANNPIATNELALRQAANAEARQAALQNLIPDRQLAEASRDSAAEALYGTARASDAQRIEEALRASRQRNSLLLPNETRISASEGLKNLSRAPAMQDAIKAAKTLYANKNKGMDLGDPLNSLEGLHYIKLAIDNQLSGGSPATALASHGKSALMGIKNDLLNEIDTVSPAYGSARKTYSELSQPITQADILEEIAKKSTNFRGDLTPAAFSRAATDKTAQTVTGMLNATLEKALTPEQLSGLQNIQKDLLAQDFAQTAGRGVGSNTVQNLAYTNMLEQFGIPTALRGFAPASVLGNVAGQAGKVAYSRANDKLAADLADALLNPRRAAELMQKATPKQQSRLVKALLRVAPVAAVGANQ